MIYHDRVTVHMKIATGDKDSHGVPIYEYVDAVVPAEVSPLTGNAGLSEVTNYVVTSRYRVVLAPTVQIPPGIGNDLTMEWGPFDTLRVDGGVEWHYRNGRLHHYELVTKEVA